MKKINVLPQTFYEFRCDKSLIDEIIPHVKEEENEKSGTLSSTSKWIICNE